MKSPTPALVAIVGAGHELGTALSRRFADGGCALALLSRGEKSRAPVLGQLRSAGHKARGYDCDAADPASVAAAFEQVRQSQGDPAVFIYNVGAFVESGILELDPERFESAWRVNCLGAFLSAREVLPAMREQGNGTLLFTGASAALRGGAHFAGLAVGKFGLRALAQSIAREFGPLGIHVAHIVIDGKLDTAQARERLTDGNEEKLLDPAAVAENYWQLYQQPRSAWTLELDLRPHVEHF